MEDDAQGMALAAMQFADPMTQIGPIETTRRTNWPVIDRKNDAITLSEWDDFSTTRLFGGALCQHEFSALKVAPWFIEEKHHLKRKHMFTVEILVQATVVVCLIAQQQRSGTLLAGFTADAEKLRMVGWEPFLYPHGRVPTVGDGSQTVVQRFAQRGDQVRQRIAEILVLTSPECITLHHDTATKSIILRKELSNASALFGIEHAWQNGIATTRQRGFKRRPVCCRESPFDRVKWIQFLSDMFRLQFERGLPGHERDFFFACVSDFGGCIAFHSAYFFGKQTAHGR